MPHKISEEAANSLFDRDGSPYDDDTDPAWTRDVHFKQELEPDNRRNEIMREEKVLDVVTITVHGEPLASNNLKFNRKTGYAFRPPEHKQRIFSVNEYSRNELLELGVTEFPLYGKGIPLYMSALLVFPYRKGDFRTGYHSDELKPNAPHWVTAKKDIDNILKPLKDGMKGIVYFDDSQVCRYDHIEKVYGFTPRTEVTIGVLTNDDRQNHGGDH